MSRAGVIDFITKHTEQPAMSPIQTHILTGFDDPRLGPDDWTRLLAQGDTDVIFLTRQYLRAWWETLG